MAEGGEVVVLHAGQEEVFDWNCNHCEDSGTFVEAVVYCPQCEEAYCEPCFQGHARFPALKSHVILSKNEQDGWGSKKTEVTDKCFLHDGQTFSMYCGSHAVVCCPVCASLEHGICENLVYIPKVAEGIFTSPELKNTLTEINSTLTFIQKMRKKKEVLRGVLGDYKSGILFNIEEERRKINETFDKLKEQATEDIDGVYRGVYGTLEDDIAVCVNAERGLSSSKKLLEDRSSEKQGFLNLKNCQKKLGTLKDGLPENLSVIPERKQLFINPEIETLTSQYVKTMENISCIGMSGCEFEVQATRTVNIRTEDDMNRCMIIDFCVLSGTIIMSDSYNKTVKVFDTSFNFKDSLILGERPQGICSVGYSKIIIAMSNQSLRFAEFAEEDGQLKETKTVELSHGCYGVAHHEAKLYITDGSRTVYIYCTACMPLGSVDMYDDYITGPFVEAGLILMDNGENLHVLDFSKGLITVNTQGKHISTRSLPDKKNIGGVCLDVHGNVFMSIKTGHSVVQLVQQADLTSRTIATSMEDLVHPGAIAIYKSSLIVANCPDSGSDSLVVLDLHVK